MPQPFSSVASRAVVLGKDDVDTDQIIPARFLTTTERRGLGQHLFADWRTPGVSGDGSGTFVLDTPDAVGAQILVAGRNFGCGSSREHAPWALTDFGFRAVVARSFADIFRGNALKNGLVPVAVDEAAYRALVAALDSEPATVLTIDLLTMTLAIPHRSWAFDLPAFSRRCLLDGVDEMGFLLSADAEIGAWERAHISPYPSTA